MMMLLSRYSSYRYIGVIFGQRVYKACIKHNAKNPNAIYREFKSVLQSVSNGSFEEYAKERIAKLDKIIHTYEKHLHIIDDEKFSDLDKTEEQIKLIFKTYFTSMYDDNKNVEELIDKLEDHKKERIRQKYVRPIGGMVDYLKSYRDSLKKRPLTFELVYRTGIDLIHAFLMLNLALNDKSFKRYEESLRGLSRVLKKDDRVVRDLMMEFEMLE